MPDLFDEKKTVEATVIEPMEDREETGLSVPGEQPQPPPGQSGSLALNDLRARAMQVPVEQMKAGLDEYWERRVAFFKWLLSKLKAGVHFGYVPGCEPRFDAKGNLVISYNKKKGNGEWERKESIVKPDQWQSKPSLYKAGADFISDLMGLRAEYDADIEGWTQMGKPAKTVVYRCRLYSRATGELVSEGRGSRSVGQKGGDENNTVKMAQKSAKVDAVLNAYGMSDLFTQDMEEKPRDPYQAPDARTDSPPAQPRARRPSEQRFTAMKRTFAEHYPKLNEVQLQAQFKKDVEAMTGERMEKPHEIFEWTPELLSKAVDYMQMNWNS